MKVLTCKEHPTLAGAARQAVRRVAQAFAESAQAFEGCNSQFIGSPAFRAAAFRACPVAADAVAEVAVREGQGLGLRDPWDPWEGGRDPRVDRVDRVAAQLLVAELLACAIDSTQTLRLL